MKPALFLLTVFCAGSAWAGDISPDCQGRFARMGQRAVRDTRDFLLGRPSLGRQIREAITEGFAARGKSGAPFTKDWSRWDDLSDSQRKLLERLPSLTPAEREEYRQLVVAAPARSVAGARYKQFLLLGLYDPETWHRLASDPLKFPTASEMAGQYLEKIGIGMPDPLREQVLSSVGAQYENLARAELKVDHGVHSAKHSVDNYFKHLLRGDKLIVSEVKSGKTPTEALGTFFQRTQSYVKEGRYYSAEEAIEVARRLQRLVRHKKVRGVRTKGTAEPTLFVGGGLPNGRATLEFSDLDVGGNFPLSRVDRKDIESYVQAYTKGIAPTADFHLALRSQSPDYWEKLYPVVFKVRAKSIEMMVYDPKGNYRTFKVE